LKFVAEAGDTVSIEIVASGDADVASNFGASMDRIAVIDYEGSCGFSPPTESVIPGLPLRQTEPGTAPEMPPLSDALAWAGLSPISGTGLPFNDTGALWVYREGYYCTGSNMDPLMYAPLLEHQCFGKCLRDEECVGDDCYCDGALKGFDNPDTRSLCLSQAKCLDLCNSIPACKSVDMHTQVNRCFLNEGDYCDRIIHEDVLTKSNFYTLYLKQNDPNDDGFVEEGQGPIYEYDDDSRRSRRLAARQMSSVAKDWGYSWAKMLRFAPISARVPGKYRVCFCDHALSSCMRDEDYRIQVGELHVSGVACLLEMEKFRRDGCENQYHGGLRCGAPTPDFPTAVAGPKLPPFSDQKLVDVEWKICKSSAAQDTETLLLCAALRTYFEGGALDSLWTLCTVGRPKDTEAVALCRALRKFAGAAALDAP
jgi:hypothetical protein